ncbi:MAG: patatin-like phospholipase family protein [Chloroflexi bacterium]|nr:patatin-like phospholipase family protein [Chloroflexota bacterium]
MPSKKRIALVIGSGSVKCAAALGLMRVLEREGISVDMYVGCSGGSLYAALLALGTPVEAIAEMSAALWTRDLTARPNRRALLQALVPALVKFDARFSLRDDRLVNRRLEEVYGGHRFEEAKTPLYITATDFMTAEMVVLSQGALFPAIRASMAIPLIFPAWELDGRMLVDGYLSDPLPVGVAIREGADVILAMGFEAAYQSRLSTLARYVFQFTSVMSNNLLTANFAFHNLAHHSEVLLLVPEFEQKVGLFDTEKIPYVIEVGEKAMEKQLPYLRQLLAA